MSTRLLNQVTQLPFSDRGVRVTGVTVRDGENALVASSVGALTVLAPLNPGVNATFCVQDASNNAATNNVTVDGNGNTIDGDATYAISTDGGVQEFLFDRGQWRKIAQARSLEEQPLAPRVISGGAIGPAGATGPAGPAGPGNVFSGTGPGNVGTITAAEVDATAVAKTPIVSVVGGVAVAAMDQEDVVLFTPSTVGRWRLDLVSTATSADGGAGGNFTVRANVEIQAGPTVSLISGGTDTDPDTSNTAGVDVQMSTSGADILVSAINGSGVALRFGWEVRCQQQAF